MRLHDLSESQGERKSRHEGLAARERGDRPGDARPGVVGLQAEPGGELAARTPLCALEAVAAVAHDLQAVRGGHQHVVQKGAQHVALETQVARVGARSDVGQAADDLVARAELGLLVGEIAEAAGPLAASCAWRARAVVSSVAFARPSTSGRETPFAAVRARRTRSAALSLASAWPATSASRRSITAVSRRAACHSASAAKPRPESRSASLPAVSRCAASARVRATLAAASLAAAALCAAAKSSAAPT